MKTSYHQARKSALQAFGLLLCLSGVFSVDAPIAHSAGCHLASETPQDSWNGGSPGRLDPWRWWTVGPVQRTYDAGRFDYYQVPSEAANCRGPACRGSTPEREISLVSTCNQSRLTFGTVRRLANACPTPPATRRVAFLCLGHTNPDHPGLFRPPSA